jgi:hypothetical protein
MYSEFYIQGFREKKFSVTGRPARYDGQKIQTLQSRDRKENLTVEIRSIIKLEILIWIEIKY